MALSIMESAIWVVAIKNGGKQPLYDAVSRLKFFLFLFQIITDTVKNTGGDLFLTCI